jgi:hypothetical protein
MSRRKARPPSPEDIKALIDSQDLPWKSQLLALFLGDPKSFLGNFVLSTLAAQMAHIERLEAMAGLAPQNIDPCRVLSTLDSQRPGKKETLKAAKKRLGLPSAGAIKQLRHKAKERLRRLRDSMPPVVTEGGRVVKVIDTQLPSGLSALQNLR